MMLTNSNLTPIQVWLYVVNKNDNYVAGAILAGLQIDGNETISIPNLYIEDGGTIQAYAATASLISLRTDIIIEG